MGVGKTTVGRAISRQLGWPLSDSDAVIAERHHSTVRELNERLGTDRMHRLEAEHLLSALAAPGPAVVCAAASVIDDPECRAALSPADVFVVWLRGSVTLLAGRFESGPHRPLLATDPAELLRRQIEQRGRLFASLADLTIDVDQRGADDVADEIRRALASLAI